MKKFVNNWQNISLALGILIGVYAFLFVEEMTQKLLLLSIAVLFLHFFEEFGFPGGFPLMGMKVLMNSKETDSTKWNCNNLSSMFGNWGFLFLIYILAVIFPEISVLTLSAMMFSFAELFMHLLLFNIKLKSVYNPGLLTGVFLLSPIAIYYFANIFDSNLFVWYDYILAVAWFVIVFLFCFRSPLYWGLGKLKGYNLSKQSAYGVQNI